MNEYELFYLVGESKEHDLERIKREVEAIVTRETGSFLEGEKLEKRKLAYPVHKEIRGTYIARRFTLPDRDAREEEIAAGAENPVSRVTHLLNLYRDVLRFIIVRAEELPPLIEVPQEATAKVVEEMAQEEKVQKAENPAVKRSTREPKVEEASVAEEKAEVPKVKAKKVAKPTMDEADLDKKLEEVLNI